VQPHYKDTNFGQHSIAELSSPITIEPCLDEAEAIVKQLRTQLSRWPHQRFRQVFTALARGDTEVGLLAYYLWRKKLKGRLLLQS
jgi:hypothetical protein